MSNAIHVWISNWSLFRRNSFIVKQDTINIVNACFCHEIIRLTGTTADEKCPHLLLRIEVYNPEKDGILVFLTNNMRFGATTIAAIYKGRGQIELFFKALKQNLKIKTFVGTSANAVKIQIWTALIAMLILKYLQERSMV